MKKIIRKKEEIYNDSWMYILLLSTIVIFGEALRTYTFTINGVKLTYAVIILPVMFLLTNYITKKRGYKTAISAICLSAVSMVTFVSIINYGLGRKLSILTIGGELSGYVISQFVGLYIYQFLLNNTKSPAILVWLNYIFVLIIFYMLYTIMNLNVLVTDDYWIGYFTTLFIQAIECLFITIIDKKIKRGL